MNARSQPSISPGVTLALILLSIGVVGWLAARARRQWAEERLARMAAGESIYEQTHKVWSHRF